MEVAAAILDRNLADEVWLMPCKHNPLKDGTTTLDDATRTDCLRLAADYYNTLRGSEDIKVDETELEMPEPSYSADTLALLSSRNPDLEFRIAVGADSYISFEKWKDWEWIESNFHPLVYPRPGYVLPELRPAWTLVEGVKQHDISSTEIRRRLMEGEGVDDAMPWINPPQNEGRESYDKNVEIKEKYL